MSWTITIVACIIIVETCCTKFVWVGLAMTTSIMVQKLSLVMIISTCLCVWWGKKWKTSLSMWAPLFNAIVATIFSSVSWVVVQSFSHEQHSKWIPKSSRVWQQWHYERCKDVRCDILRQIQSVERKWVEDKQNEGVLRIKKAWAVINTL